MKERSKSDSKKRQWSGRMEVKKMCLYAEGEDVRRERNMLAGTGKLR